MPEGGIKAEIKQRVASARGAFKEGRVKVFRCKRVSVARRGVLLSSLVMSRLTFGSGAWPPLSAADSNLFGGTVTSLYRATLGLSRDADQHVTLAMMCSLLGLLDAETLLRIEQLRYLRQLLGHAPDVLWALVRVDTAYLNVLREALAWLYRRVQATCQLPDPLLEWDVWCRTCLERPGLFKGLIKRAQGLELCRVKCYAAFQSLHRVIRELCDGLPAESHDEPPTFVEACLICKKGFESRVAWACHSSKKHGYRVIASVLAGSRGDTVCQGCGKCFSRASRLRRHLLHSSSCRVNWGAFTPAHEDAPVMHDRQPPVTLERVLEEHHAGPDPALYHQGLLSALHELCEPSAEDVWQTLIEYVEPLDVLRNTVKAWHSSLGSTLWADEVCEDVLLMLDPVLCCETFCKTRTKPKSAVCCPDLPGPFSTSLSFVLTGALTTVSISEPPCPGFAFPFIGGVSLAAAKRQCAFLEASCEAIGVLIQRAQSSRVFLRISRQALQALEPVPTWLMSVGFSLVGEGLCSPTD